MPWRGWIMRKAPAKPAVQLKVVSFRIDGEALAALERLEKKVAGAGSRGRRSILLRQLILAADKKK